RGIAGIGRAGVAVVAVLRDAPLADAVAAGRLLRAERVAGGGIVRMGAGAGRGVRADVVGAWVVVVAQVEVGLESAGAEGAHPEETAILRGTDAGVPPKKATGPVAHAGVRIAFAVRRAERPIRVVDATAGVVGQANAVQAALIAAIARAARQAVAAAARIVDRAGIAVVARARGAGPGAGAGRRIAGVDRAGIAVVAIHGRMRALAVRGIADILGAEVSIGAVLGTSLAGDGAGRRGHAGVPLGAGVPVVAHR